MERQLSLFAHERQRRARYVVADPFLSAWLSVLQPACQAARIEPSSRIVDRFVATKEGSRFRDWHRELALFSPRFPVAQRAGLEADGWVCRDLVDVRRMLLPEDRGANGRLPASVKIEGSE